MLVRSKVCPKCAEKVKPAASICRFCGNEFGDEDTATPPLFSDETTHRRVSGKAIFAAGALALCLLIGVGIWAQSSIPSSNSADKNLSTTTDPFAHIGKNQSSRATVGAATNVNEIVTSDPEPAAASWAYVNDYDQLRGGTIYRATLDSQNSVFFDFPYQGGSSLSMSVRKHPQFGEDVIFRISKGQFVCHVDDCSGTINFGSGPQQISLSEPDDNASDTLFASDPELIIEQLKKAKKVVIELPFYQEGNRQFNFVINSSLAWPPKGSAVPPKASRSPQLQIKPDGADLPSQNELDEAFPSPQPRPY